MATLPRTTDLTIEWSWKSDGRKRDVQPLGNTWQGLSALLSGERTLQPTLHEADATDLPPFQLALLERHPKGALRPYRRSIPALAARFGTRLCAFGSDGQRSDRRPV